MVLARTGLDEILETFSLLEDWEERYRYLIDLGRGLPSLDDADKNDQTKVAGCTSQVWMRAHVDAAGVFHMKADSDAHIVRGLIAILHAASDARPARDVAALDFPKLFGALGLDDNLSPNRRNGLYAMAGRIQAVAAGAAGAG